MIKIAFFKASKGDIVDKVISWWTRPSFWKIWKSGKYSHCEIVYLEDDKQFTGLSAYFDNGVRLATFDKSDKWDFVSVDVSDKDLEKFYNLHKDKKYDFKGIFLTFLFPLKSQDSNKYFCSELVSKYLKSQKYDLGKRPSRIHPNKLYEIITKG